MCQRAVHHSENKNEGRRVSESILLSRPSFKFRTEANSPAQPHSAQNPTELVVFIWAPPGECHGQRRLVGYSPRGSQGVGHDEHSGETTLEWRQFSAGIPCTHPQSCHVAVKWSCMFKSRPTLRRHGLQVTRLLRPWDSPGKSTGVGCHFLLQGIFLTQRLNPCLLYHRQMLY